MIGEQEDIGISSSVDVEEVLCRAIDQFVLKLTEDGLSPDQVQFFAGGLAFARKMMDVVAQGDVAAYSRSLIARKEQLKENAAAGIEEAYSKQRRPARPSRFISDL